MAKYKVSIEVQDGEQAKEHAKMLIETLHRLPSMADKLPNYLMERVDKVVEFSERYGWEWLTD
jgi:hypothetical protein